MNIKTKLAFVLAGLLVASGGFAIGLSSPYKSGVSQEIYGCVTGVNGNITKVSNFPQSCPKGTSSITWNVLGPQGNIGPKGDQGLRGERGPNGITGGLYISNANGITDALVTSLDHTGDGTYYLNGDLYPFSYVNGQVFLASAKMADLVLDINSTNPLAAGGDYDVLFKEEDCSGTPYFFFGAKGHTIRLNYSADNPFHDYSLISEYLGKTLLQSESVPINQMKGRYWWDQTWPDNKAKCVYFPSFASRTEMVYKLDLIKDKPAGSSEFDGPLYLTKVG